jgi:hypothetical protein
MSTKNPPFTILLTTAELGWLAGAFGLTRLALPVAITLPSDDGLREAQQTLAGRGLIQRDPGTGWKADQLAAFLIQWLGMLEHYSRLDVDRWNGGSLRAGLYARPGLYLLADCTRDPVEFFFLPDEKSCSEKLAAFLDLAPVRHGEGVFTLPEPRQLIQAAWQDPSPARRALGNAGLSKRETTSVLKWIASLKTVITFTSSQNEPLSLCSDGSALWMSISGKLKPCCWKDAARRMQEML